MLITFLTNGLGDILSGVHIFVYKQWLYGMLITFLTNGLGASLSGMYICVYN